MPTALITGASAGLGESFARQLAKDGHDLILTARRVDLLETLATELRDKHGVQAHVFAGDLAEADAPDRLLADIAAAGLPIDLLVNNAGYGARGEFAALDATAQLGIIDVNCRALVSLAHGVLPQMVARGAGAILNIASTAAFQPGPWMTVYYASKAFVLSFSEGLHEEVAARGVTVTALCPGPTRTEFADRAGMTDLTGFDAVWADADTVVRDGLDAVRARRAVKVSGTMNTVMADTVRFLPRILARKITGTIQKTRG